MKARVAHLVGLACAVTTAACGTSPPARFYTLTATAPAGDAVAARTTVIVGPVTVPASVDRPEMVVQLAPNQVTVDEFNRWASPLGDAVARTVAGNLAQLLGNAEVATAPLAHFKPAYRVTISVQRFESIPGQTALVDAVWVVHRAANGSSESGHTVAREAVQGDGYDALAAAHSRALASLSADIAAAMRTQIGTAP